MAVLSVLTVPDIRLKRRAEPVETVDAGVRALMEDMLETMHASRGIGLAAPQVGIAKRVIVLDIAGPEETPQPFRMANPELLWRSGETCLAEEGCLSLPDQYADVERPDRIRVRYLDQDNQVRELDASGLLARCIQHEMDHLTGTLFVDHLSMLKRNIILRKLQKQKKQQLATA